MSFSDIRGQERPINILKGYMDARRLAGGYLFSGPDGIGKKLAAKTLAKALNCLEKDSDSCDRCPSCIKIEKNQHPDVHFIDEQEGDSIKIEHIRQLQKEINLRPYEGRWKVFVIDKAHNLTAEASNALLKTLEEPPEKSLIILIASRPTLLFKTVLSRCKTLRFYPLSRAALEEMLKSDYKLESKFAHFLAHFCDGRIGCAFKLKDEDAIKEKNKVIDELIFSRGRNLYNPMPDKETFRMHINILAGWFRDMYFMKIGMPHAQLINLDRKEELLSLMSRYAFIDLDGIFNFLSDALLYLDENVNSKLLLSNLRVRLWKE